MENTQENKPVYLTDEDLEQHEDVNLLGDVKEVVLGCMYAVVSRKKHLNTYLYKAVDGRNLACCAVSSHPGAYEPQRASWDLEDGEVLVTKTFLGRTYGN